MTPEVERIIDAKVKKRHSLGKQADAVDWAIYFLASFTPGKTVEEMQEELEPLKAARATLKRLSEKRS